MFSATPLKAAWSGKAHRLRRPLHLVMQHAPGSGGCSTCVACRGITHDLDKGGQQPSPEAGSHKQRPDASHNDLYGHEELWDNELIQLAPTLQARNALPAECCLLHLAEGFPARGAKLASAGGRHVTPRDSPPVQLLQRGRTLLHACRALGPCLGVVVGMSWGVPCAVGACSMLAARQQQSLPCCCSPAHPSSPACFHMTLTTAACVTPQPGAPCPADQ